MLPAEEGLGHAANHKTCYDPRKREAWHHVAPATDLCRKYGENGHEGERGWAQERPSAMAEIL